MEFLPTTLTPWLVAAGVVGIIIALIFTLRAYVLSRSGAYYAVREQALRTSGRGLIVVIILVVLTITIVLLPKKSNSATSTPTETIRLVPTPTVILITSTALPTATPAAWPTATEPFIPTATPTAKPPFTALTPIPSAQPPPADARIQFVGLAQLVNESGVCQEATDQFSVGVQRLNLCYKFDGLVPSVPWTVAWYCGGEYLGGGTSLWQSQNPSGNAFVFLSPSQGYPEGECEVQVWLTDRLQFRVQFEIVKDN